MALIFKILPALIWNDAVAKGQFSGAGIDLADGYIHFSSETQLRETARRHFAGQDGLVLVAFDADSFGAALKWEPSRGGQLFPHLYGDADPGKARWVKALPWNGVEHVFPEGVAV